MSEPYPTKDCAACYFGPCIMETPCENTDVIPRTDAIKFALSIPVVREVCDALAEACDLMDGMLIGARMLRGDTGTLQSEPTPEIVRFRALLARATGDKE